MFTERQLAPGGEKWIVVAFLSVGRMPLIPFLPQWKYNNLVCKLSCKVCPAPWEILVLLHICNELKHRSRCYWCSQDATKICLMLSSGFFCLFWFRVSLAKSIGHPAEGNSYLQNSVWSPARLTGWLQREVSVRVRGRKMKTFHVRKTVKDGKPLEDRLGLRKGN